MSTQTLPRARAAHGPGAISHWAPLVVVLTGIFMVVLDFFIVNVAMPAVQDSLRASAGSIEWVVAGYALTVAVLLIAGGRLGDRYGRRRAFMVGMALFTLSSAICGTAPDATVLVIGRLLQGIGGALLTTNMIALIGVLYPGEDRPRAMAAYGMVMGVAAVGGQLIGGALLAWNPFGLDWRSCFLINVPIGLAALVLASRLIPESRGEPGATLDLPGVGLITAALTTLVLPLLQGRQAGWAAWIWITVACAPVLFVAFALQQRALTRRGGTPLLPSELFRLRSFRIGLVAQTVFWCGQGSFFLILALYLQQGRGLSPLQAGLVFTALAGTYLVSSMQAPMLAARNGRGVITAAALLLVAGHGALIATVAVTAGGGSVLWLLPALMVIGAGMGLGIAPLATNLLATLAPERAGAASGALSTAQYVGSSLGVAVVGVAFFGALGGGYAHALEHGLGVLVLALALVAGLSRLLP